MKAEIEQGPFYRSVMSGLLAGIVITIANLVFNGLYRSITSFNPSQFVNVTTIIFVSLLLSLVSGIIYYLLVPYAKKSSSLFMILFVILTIVVTFVAFTVNRSSDPKVSAQFHGLFAGIAIITGLIDAFLIPYLVKHENPVF
jgi:hypothetical protein